MAETRRVDAVARIAHLLQGLLKHPYAVSQATRPAIGALMKGNLGSGRSRFYSLYLAAAFGAFDTGKSCPWHPFVPNEHRPCRPSRMGKEFSSRRVIDDLVGADER